MKIKLKQKDKNQIQHGMQPEKRREQERTSPDKWRGADDIEKHQRSASP